MLLFIPYTLRQVLAKTFSCVSSVLFAAGIDKVDLCQSYIFSLFGLVNTFGWLEISLSQFIGCNGVRDQNLGRGLLMVQCPTSLCWIEHDFLRQLWLNLSRRWFVNSVSHGVCSPPILWFVSHDLGTLPLSFWVESVYSRNSGFALLRYVVVSLLGMAANATLDTSYGCYVRLMFGFL